MGERTDQIEQHIKRQRDELEDNFSELERKVRDAFDWRTQFQEHPGAMLGAALVGGALMGVLLPGRSSVTAKVNSRRRSFSELSASQPAYSVPQPAPAPSAWNAYAAPSGEVAQKTAEVWDNLKGAAIAMAATRLGDAMEELIPGFANHYKKAAGNSKTRGAKAVWPYSVPKPTDSSPTTEANQKPDGGTDYGSHS